MSPKTEKFWDKQADNFDKADEEFEHIRSEVMTLTGKYLNLGDKVLDCGCATGTITIKLAKSVGNITGIDISSRMIEKAINKVRDLNVNNVEFLHTDLYNNVLKKGSFDAILAFNILHLINNPAFAVSKINQLLTPDGILISTTACLKEKKTFKSMLGVLLFRIAGKIGIMPDMLTFFNADQLERLIRDAGFKILKTERFFKGMTGYFIAARKISDK